MAMGQLSALTIRAFDDLAFFQATQKDVQELGRAVSLQFLAIVAPILGATALTGVVANVSQTGFLLTSQPLSPDFTRLDPLKGMARLFSVRSSVELIKSIAKAGVIGVVAWHFLNGERATLASLSVTHHTVAARTAAELVWRLSMRACVALLIIAGLDYLYQRIQHEKTLRMTRQEVKEEMRRSEGDPLVKSQFKQRHRQLAMQRMMQDVPKADVVVTNPTHLAVALRYDPESMAAPAVVAKGQRLIAEKIKEIARKHRVPLVENKPVARMLFKSTEIGSPVPVELYQAIAEILAYVYRLRRPR
jgi:flagellar biosynthetic protein FlhB